MSAARVARTAIALAVVGGAIAGGALGISGTDTITTVAGSSQGFSGDGGPATQARLDAPIGVALDAQGRILIADFANQRVRRVGTNGVITTIAGIGGTGGFSGDGGPATAAALNLPFDVAADAAGNVYVSDQNNHRVRKISPSGIISTIAGNGNAAFSGDGGPSTAAEVSFPNGLDVGPDGSVYLADLANNRIRRIAPNGIITTVAGNGTAGFSGDGGPATQAQLQFPVEVAVGADGATLLIADQTNHRVRRVAPNGIITSIAGTGTAGFLGDGGPATAARISQPLGIEQDAAGNVYVSDSGSQRVRKIDAAGVIRTVAGNGTATPLGEGGEAQAAAVGPRSLVVDPLGNLLIADAQNHRIRKVLNLAPVASFAAFPASGPAPLGVAFDGSASSDPNGAIISHSWDFGDGTTGSGAKVGHTYGAPGAYAVKLTVRDDSGAVASSSKTVTAGPPGTATAGLALTGASFDVRWRASRLRRGRLVIAGGTARAASLRVQLRLRGKVVLTRRFRATTAGPFVRRLPLPARLLPGAYVVRISEAGGGAGRLPTQERRATLAPPREGVVARAFVSTKIGGRSLARIAGRPSIIFAHFAFAARPKKGERLSVSWFQPGVRRPVAVDRKPISPLVIAFVKSRGPLPTGRWRAELRYGGKLVATALVRLV
jgi:sugar lactone lactonase YvrE